MPQQPELEWRRFFFAPNPTSTIWPRLVSLCPLLSPFPKNHLAGRCGLFFQVWHIEFLY
jgi:hypothetical protein